MTTKTITGKDIYEAMVLNGFDVLRGDWFRFNDDGSPVAACILGQAAINLGVSPNSDFNYSQNLVGVLERFKVPTDSKWAIDDGNDEPLGIGTAIMFNFDASNKEARYYSASAYANAKSPDEYYGKAWDDAYNEYMLTHPLVYKLTWDESLDMAKELLTPIWDTPLEVQEYSFGER